MTRFRLLSCLFLFFCTHLSAQWTTDTLQNTIIKDKADAEETVCLSAGLPDGSLYISWYERNLTTNNYDVRLQLLNPQGVKQLGADGLLVSGERQGSALFVSDLKADRDGNAILGFQDYRDNTAKSHCVVYKISKTGQFLWGNKGIVLHDTIFEPTSSGLSPSIGFTNAGNTIVVWNESGTRSYLAMQKISPTGTLMWSDNRRVRDTGTTYTRRFSRGTAVPTGADEFILHYVRATGSGLGVSIMFCNRYDANGQALWREKLVSNKTIGFAHRPSVLPDANGGFYVAFNSGHPTSAALNDVWVQRIKADSSSWTTDGVEMADATGVHKLLVNIQVLPNRNEVWTLFHVLNSAQSLSGFTVQKTDTLGNLLLGNNGKEIFPIPANTTDYVIGYDIKATSDGLIALYEQDATFNKEKMRAFKINFSGVLQWVRGISAVESGKGRGTLGLFGANQVVAVWQDMRLSSTGGIYAQNINNAGVAGARVGIQEPFSIRTASLYPNPSVMTETPTLLLDLKTSEWLDIQVLDVNSRVLSQIRRFYTAGQQNIPLSMPAHFTGLYLVNIKTEQGIKTLKGVR
ncbi:MAG: T9SS type A sorting domain-containing protein [Saprospiraceae bacterium]|nr:T9SS type A sorting domain-containing protein [Saprospiraceae bacterium]